MTLKGRDDAVTMFIWFIRPTHTIQMMMTTSEVEHFSIEADDCVAEQAFFSIFYEVTFVNSQVRFKWELVWCTT